MFEKEAEEWVKKEFPLLDVKHTNLEESITEYRAYKNGAEFGYNKGYHDAEEHYLNVIDSQHKLVDESRKKDFKKCMKCTDGTYQYGFKDGYNKANEWHYVKDELPPIKKEYCGRSELMLVVSKEREMQYAQYVEKEKTWARGICAISFEPYAWKEIVLPELPKEIKEK